MLHGKVNTMDLERWSTFVSHTGVIYRCQDKDLYHSLWAINTLNLSSFIARRLLAYLWLGMAMVTVTLSLRRCTWGRLFLGEKGNLLWEAYFFSILREAWFERDNRIFWWGHVMRFGRWRGRRFSASFWVSVARRYNSVFIKSFIFKLMFLDCLPNMPLPLEIILLRMPTTKKSIGLLKINF